MLWTKGGHSPLSTTFRFYQKVALFGDLWWWTRHKAFFQKDRKEPYKARVAQSHSAGAFVSHGEKPWPETFSFLQVLWLTTISNQREKRQRVRPHRSCTYIVWNRVWKVSDMNGYEKNLSMTWESDEFTKKKLQKKQHRDFHWAGQIFL